MTATAASVTLRPAGGVRAKSLHLLVAAVILLAVLGAVLAAWTVIGTRPVAAAGIGDPVDTGFGTFTVTRVSKTFVPDTQGPPSAAQHAGTNGSDQLQVWVRLANTAGGKGVALSPGQFSLASETGGQKPLRAAGSTLEKGLLEPGGSIDGQVWFDPPPGSAGRRWLLFTAPDGNTVRVSLGTVALFRSPSHDEKPSGGGDKPSGHTHGG
jgi:hypothetical protein